MFVSLLNKVRSLIIIVVVVVCIGVFFTMRRTTRNGRKSAALQTLHNSTIIQYFRGGVSLGPSVEYHDDNTYKWTREKSTIYVLLSYTDMTTTDGHCVPFTLCIMFSVPFRLCRSASGKHRSSAFYTYNFRFFLVPRK